VRGLELSRGFYHDAVRPILERRFPGLDHAAALIGTGSEVLGFDDETSTDHHWGPRLQLFLRELDAAPAISGVLTRELPVEFGGFPTNFGSPDPVGVRLLQAVAQGPVQHRIECFTVGGYLVEEIGVDPLAHFEVADWLVTPAQRLLEVTAGEVFVDAMGDLTRARSLLAWYPHDVWLLVMAGHWRRIAQREHLLGRTGQRGDELGSRLIAASLAGDLIRLAFLQERRYAPYPKWLGTAYAQLGRREQPVVEAAVSTTHPRAREDALVDAYRAVAEAHNELGVTEAVDPEARQFYGRPFRVLFADRFVAALRAAVRDPAVRAVGHLAGSVDASSENVDVLTRPPVWRELRGLYDRPKPEDWRLDGL